MTIWICPHTLVTSDENIYKKALETIGLVMREVIGVTFLDSLTQKLKPFDTPGLLMGMIYYKIQQDRADRQNRVVKEFHTDIEVSKKEIEEGKFFLEYAEVVYGRYRKLPKIGGFDFTYAEKVIFYYYSWFQMTKAEKKMECALKYLKIKKEDVIVEGNWEPQLYKPTFLLFFDHKVETIGLSICGTKSWNDCLTDLAAGEKLESNLKNIGVVEFFEGICHSGMAKAAQYLAEILRDDIKAAREKHPKYRVVIAGHSLGAGTAAILSIMYSFFSIVIDLSDFEVRDYLLIVMHMPLLLLLVMHCQNNLTLTFAHFVFKMMLYAVPRWPPSYKCVMR
jgi:hypothetical protein